MSEGRKDSSPATAPTPARGYSRPPFEPGNAAAVRHGGYSAPTIMAAAAEIRDTMLENYPYLADVLFVESLELYCGAMARVRLFRDAVMKLGEEKGAEAVPTTLVQDLNRAEANASRFASECGLSAASHSRIARDLGLAQGAGRRLSAMNQTGPKLGDRGKALREAQGRG